MAMSVTAFFISVSRRATRPLARDRTTFRHIPSHSPHSPHSLTFHHINHISHIRLSCPAALLRAHRYAHELARHRASRAHSHAGRILLVRETAFRQYMDAHQPIPGRRPERGQHGAHLRAHADLFLYAGYDSQFDRDPPAKLSFCS